MTFSENFVTPQREADDDKRMALTISAAVAFPPTRNAVESFESCFSTVSAKASTALLPSFAENYEDTQ